MTDQKGFEQFAKRPRMLPEPDGENPYIKFIVSVIGVYIVLTGMIAESIPYFFAGHSIWGRWVYGACIAIAPFSFMAINAWLCVALVRFLDEIK